MVDDSPTDSFPGDSRRNKTSNISDSSKNSNSSNKSCCSKNSSNTDSDNHNSNNCSTSCQVLGAHAVLQDSPPSCQAEPLVKHETPPQGSSLRSVQSVPQDFSRRCCGGGCPSEKSFVAISSSIHVALGRTNSGSVLPRQRNGSGCGGSCSGNAGSCRVGDAPLPRLLENSNCDGRVDVAQQEAVLLNQPMPGVPENGRLAEGLPTNAREQSELMRCDTSALQTLDSSAVQDTPGGSDLLVGSKPLDRRAVRISAKRAVVRKRPEPESGDNSKPKFGDLEDLWRKDSEARNFCNFVCNAPAMCRSGQEGLVGVVGAGSDASGGSNEHAQRRKRFKSSGSSIQTPDSIAAW